MLPGPHSNIARPKRGWGQRPLLAADGMQVCGAKCLSPTAGLDAHPEPTLLSVGSNLF